ncbi:MAG TPA: type II toxin-antitoxin system VapC family toxin [Microthrixaceae bacterium]|nr:type II toxin-antitoxin system VapC family toxin [Microthrixaceae bacterium]
MIVVDASVLANALADDGADGATARDRLTSAGELAAPDLIDVETVAVLRKRWIASDLTDQRLSDAIDDLEDLDLTRYPTLPLMRRAFELRSNMTAYDAAYIALAERLDCSLLTADQRLATAPTITCPVEVLHT